MNRVVETGRMRECGVGWKVGRRISFDILVASSTFFFCSSVAVSDGLLVFFKRGNDDADNEDAVTHGGLMCMQARRSAAELRPSNSAPPNDRLDWTKSLRSREGEMSK